MHSPHNRSQYHLFTVVIQNLIGNDNNNLLPTCSRHNTTVNNNYIVIPTCSRRKTSNNTIFLRNRVCTKDVVSKTTTYILLIMDADNHVGRETNSICNRHKHHLQCHFKIKRYHIKMLRKHPSQIVQSVT